ncbi:MAG: hypothetical protein H6Q48_5197 [Deltaproteobacteria bacterium]|nr:hypothetical protein [Deltaproteobacteria bacterium]
MLGAFSQKENPLNPKEKGKGGLLKEVQVKCLPDFEDEGCTRIPSGAAGP